MKARCFCLLFLVLFVAAGAVAGEPKAERVSAPPPSTPKSIGEALQPQGYRILGADGSPLAEIWFRKDVPVSGNKEVEGANYPALTPGMLLGVISFPAATKDFRGQAIKPGTYTLRYELLPNDGNHMGVAPDRDFMLLAPVADDPGPAATIKFDELVKLSSRATGASHPAVLSMVAAGKRSLPAAYTDANDYTVFAADLNTASGELPLALIIKGVSMSF